MQFSFKVLGHKPLLQHIAVGQLINHARVLHQIPRRPLGGAQKAQQAFMHRGALEHHGQITFAAHQGLHPVCHADHRIDTHTALLKPLGRALQQTHQPASGIVSEAFDFGAVLPMRQTRSRLAFKQIQHSFKLRALAGCLGVTGFALPIAAQQDVKLVCNHFTVGIQIREEITAFGVSHGIGNPLQVGILGWQNMRLLVIQILNAMLYFAKKHIGLRQSLRRFHGHQARFGNALKRVEGGPCAKLRKLPAANNLQKLHGEFNFPNAAARQLDIVGALGVASASFGGVIANLLVQGSQRLKDVVV